ncbi:Oidioi.mRNA.OKI2018_I69.XSR.g17013.t1.cds [Oikopleura dioica]|uniref:Oidioi.mRNA.OKI2018_I69.XSR.g17013.t1.cds n=1 Tax=Oikopleura dioica TaxID=34765 RepID=A0ABN7SN29_OIKDI|nr:Oidioi.mRNA.OKI2018_I69.XSR.g17013.t1.cds [Oikopleura dioica]
MSFEELNTWLSSFDGFVSPNVATRDFRATGRGIVANENLRKFEKIFQIPQALIISGPRMLKNAEVLSIFSTSSVKVDISQVFILWLYLEIRKGKKSPFHTYLDSIPQRYWMGICVPEEVHPCIPKQTLATLRDEIVFCCIFSKKGSQMKGRINYTQFCHLYAIVKSRVVGVCGLVYNNKETEEIKWIEWGSPYDDAILCPVFDLLNNSCDSNASYSFDPSSKSMLVEMEEDIKAGSQVFICYGPKCDDVLFNNYGFVFKSGENQENSIRVFPEEVISELRQQGKQTCAQIDEKYQSLLRQIEDDATFHLAFDQMKLRRGNVDWNLWYFVVWMTGGSVEELSSIRSTLNFSSSSEAKQRVNALDVILAILRKRLNQLAETANAQAKLTLEIPDWYLKTLKTLRSSHNQLMTYWYDELVEERKNKRNHCEGESDPGQTGQALYQKISL